MKKYLLAMLTAMCLCLAAVACGGGDSEETTAAETQAETTAEETKEETTEETEAPATEAPTEAAGTVVGTWKLDPTCEWAAEVESADLEIREDGTFSLTAESNGVTAAVEGTYTLENSHVILTPTSANGQDPTELETEDCVLDSNGRLVADGGETIFVREGAASQAPTEALADLSALAGTWLVDPDSTGLAEVGGGTYTMEIQADGTFSMTLDAQGQTTTVSGTCTYDGIQLVLNAENGEDAEAILDAQGNLYFEDDELIFAKAE